MSLRALILLPLIGMLAPACGPSAPPPPKPGGELVVPRAASELPRLDPAAASWQHAPEVLVALLPQDLVEPKLLVPAVGELRVRALHDGHTIVFRLRWQDRTRDVLAGPGRFSDGCAVQIPATAGGDVTDPAMGLEHRPVHISFWKAAWQETADPVAALRPNMAVDHYPFRAARPAAQPAMERLYAPARGAANPIALREPGAAVQDLLAEGPGTLAPTREQRSSGKGAWRDGAWTVTIARPLELNGASTMPVGRRTHVAFAVWEGGAHNTGAKKMRSVWLPVTLEPAR